MRISAKSQYGLRALIYLAKSKKKICPLKEIAENEGIPFDYLEKIIAKLEKQGVVQSKRGAKGGYFLPCPPKKIKIKDVMEALDEQSLSVACLKKEKITCPKERKCLAKNFWQTLQDSIDKTLSKITLKDLINP